MRCKLLTFSSKFNKELCIIPTSIAVLQKRNTTSAKKSSRHNYCTHVGLYFSPVFLGRLSFAGVQPWRPCCQLLLDALPSPLLCSKDKTAKLFLHYTHKILHSNKCINL